MNGHAATHINRLCAPVDPSVRSETVYTAEVLDMSFDLRLVYIANDDLAFINQCTNQWDEHWANQHREPYYSVACSNSGQTFIVSLAGKPVCVAEVLHAPQNYAGEEFDPKDHDFLVQLFFMPGLGPVVHFGTMQFFTNYCSRFEEVWGLIINTDNNDLAALEQVGYRPMKNSAGDANGFYYYSTSNEKE